MTFISSQIIPLSSALVGQTHHFDLTPGKQVKGQQLWLRGLSGPEIDLG